MSLNKLDIIIVNYKSEDCLFLCLKSVYDSIDGMNFGVLIYDNSPDDKMGKISKAFPQVKIIRNDANIGFAAAVNKGLKKSNAPYVMLLNPDTVVEKGTLNTLCSYLDNEPRVGVVGPKILNSDGSIQGSARSFPTPMTGLFGRTSFFSRIFPNNKFTRKNILVGNDNLKNPLRVDWVSGACMVVRRSAFNKVGLLDEQFFMYWEDADWCRRMSQNGWLVKYLPNAMVLHLVGKSSRKHPIRSNLEFHKSAYRLFEKYSKWPQKFLTPLVFLALTIHFYLKSATFVLKKDKH